MIDIASFHKQNPWRIGKHVPEKSFRRYLLDELLRWLNEPEILVIIGSRQVGKTTLLRQMMEHLLAGGTAPEDIFYFNLDDLSLLDFFNTPAQFLDFIELNQTQRGYIFIDEMQRLENPGIFLKYVYDLKKKLKLIVTGSSALEIRAKISESLTGRKRLFHLHPFSFGEFLEARWVDFPWIANKLGIEDLESFAAAIKKVQSIYQATFENMQHEYLIYGGYPRVVLERDLQKKIDHLQEIFTSYLQKDVKDFFKIENVGGYNNLLKMLAHQIGNLINVSELANTLGLHKATIEKYLQVLEGTFIFKRLTPFFQNVRRELSKMPKIYALDLGMRNFAAGNFGEVAVRGDRGELAENFVFAELNRLVEAPGELHFWRTQTQAEVDLIIERAGAVVPIGVKFTAMKSPQISRSFKSFLSTYRPECGLVFSKDYAGELQAGETRVIFLPLWSLLFFKLDYVMKK